MGKGGGGKGQSSDNKGTNTILMAAAAGTGVSGCLLFPVIILILLAGVLVVCAIGFFFWPLVIICSIFGCGGGDGEASVDNDRVSEVFASDGRGELNEAAVPAGYLEYVKDAGQECDRIGSMIIAAQIQQESQWNDKLVGVNGKKGISQLPPDKFDEFGEDDNDNDKTSALDAGDSIMAQGRYLCSLSGEIETLVASRQVTGDHLDLTLAAYSVGLDAVKKAKGVPAQGGAQSYIYGIRSSFAIYSDAIKLPEGESYPTISPLPTGSVSTPPEGGQ
ncbi:transglycosylase SLT domain-containing protein [Streptomyces niveus]|uniref:transglycosylase SLT domain-containing protein n=1 Tax=Streptomyces niveus TaxID=193462 RepID=UPI003426EA8D